MDRYRRGIRAPRLRPPVALLAAAPVAAALAACAGGDAAAPETVTVTVTADAPERAGPPADRPRDLRETATLVDSPLPASPAGHLAYVGSDGNVYVVDPVTAATVQVTRDRSSAGTDGGIFHAGLAWSPAGELAFARTDVDSFRSAVFVTVPGSGVEERVAAPGGMLIYASWSPAECEDPGCSRLAYVADADGAPGGPVALTLLEQEPEARARPAREDRGEQIYFAWAEGPDAVVRHLPGSAPRLDRVDAAGGERPIPAPLGPFLAPAVTGGRAVYAVADAAGSEPAVTVRERAVIIHVPRDTRRVAFAPSPDGARLALATRGGPKTTPPAAFGRPWVADLETGELARIARPGLWTEAFYWSPDGRRLAYLTWLDNDLRPYNQWRLFDARDGSDTGLASFQPTPAFDTLTTFFDQFGQSHSFWSPDGRFLAFGAVGDGGRDEVRLLDLADGGAEIVVADGAAGVFSRP